MQMCTSCSRVIDCTRRDKGGDSSACPAYKKRTLATPNIYQSSRSDLAGPGAGIYSASSSLNEDGTYDATLVYQRPVIVRNAVRFLDRYATKKARY
ncbi:MAG: hypothetical protein ACYTEQ_03430 [Planctomycetota bacterium]|jgi:hypothetical protein